MERRRMYRVWIQVYTFRRQGALHKESQQFVPYYYRNDNMGMEQYGVRWTEEGVLLNRRLQADHTVFANQWLRNIATQQHLL